MEKRRGESVPLGLMVPIFRKFVCLVTFVFFTSFFFLYFGTVQWHSHTNELVSIEIIDEDVSSSSQFSSSTKAMSTPIDDQIATDDKRKNPFGLTPVEIQHQFETASIPSLKRRVKRFACWHSCFGPFRKKVIGRPYSLKATTTKPPSASPASATGKDKGKGKGKGKSAKAPDNNELGDGEDEADILTPMQGKPRKKKASNPLDYFKLKTKVIVARDTGSSTTTARTTVPPVETSPPQNLQSENRVVKRSSSTRAPTNTTTTTTTTTTTKRPETKKTHPTKKAEPVFGSYVEKKKSTTAKPAQVAVKVQAKSESGESDEGKDSRGASEEGSASAEGGSSEDDEGSDSEEESAEH